MVHETVGTVLVTVFSHKNLDTLDLSTKLDALSPSTTEFNREGPRGGGHHFHTYIAYIHIMIYIYTHTFYPLFYFLCLFWNKSVFSHRMKVSRFFTKGQELDTGGDGSATGRSLMVEGPYQKPLFLGGVGRLGVGWFLSWFQFLEGLNLSFLDIFHHPKDSMWDFWAGFL